MKTIILCGGMGTRLAEETHLRPKPMVEIGGRPILWHIMNRFSDFGQNDFLLALGYKGEYIKEYFLNYYQLNSDFNINLGSGKTDFLGSSPKKWNVGLIDTGLSVLTGGRLLRLKDQLKGEETFMLTYGDGVANVNIDELLEFHKNHGKIATVTGVRPPARFGEMIFGDGDKVIEFKEKPQATSGWINRWFFCF